MARSKVRLRSAPDLLQPNRAAAFWWKVWICRLRRVAEVGYRFSDSGTAVTNTERMKVFLDPFGPPIYVEGEFLDVESDRAGSKPLATGGPTVMVMHDILRFKVWIGNFHIIYPVLINWITGNLQPAERCLENTSKGPIERCSYPVQVEAHREDQPTFVRLFPEPD